MNGRIQADGGVRLTPAHELRWEGSADGDGRVEAFALDWRAALFDLAAEGAPASEAPSARYWRLYGARHLAALCHIPDQADAVATVPPAAEDAADWVMSAPPMRGGEYLKADALLRMWAQLDDWARRAAAQAGGLAALLGERAPNWRQVGRVCFRLAENRSDEERPFAFMATYASSFGASGRLQHLPLRRALEQYAGESGRPALVKLLSPVQCAADACGWVRDLVESGEIYQATAWSPERAYQLLLSAQELEDSGLSVQLPDWWRKRARPRMAVTIGKEPTVMGADALLDFKAEVALGDEALSPEELQSLLQGPDGLVMLKGQWVEVDRDKLREAIAHWESLRQDADGAVSFMEGMRLLAGVPADLGLDGEDEGDWVRVAPGEGLRGLLAKLREPGALDPEPIDGGLQAKLRPYQRTGVSWLRFLSTLGLGACLADDMGLGKTLQVLAMLLCARGGAADARPSLLVAPASLMSNWRQEAERFAPSLELRLLHPSEAKRQGWTDLKQAQQGLEKVDLAVTTYSMLSRLDWLADVDWRWVVIDEAQAIKNPASRQSRAVRRLKAQSRIALTGTPVENRLGDLWALFDFLNPGLLGSPRDFKRFTDQLERRADNPYAPLRSLVAPYILRRLKTDSSVISDLPDKTEVIRHCHLTKAQVPLYQQVVRSLQETLRNSDGGGMARRGAVLNSLMALKQVCNHPSQASGDELYRPADSGKFLRLREICAELAERQERVLVFTQFKVIMEPLANCLADVFGRPGLMLHGSVPVAQRRSLVDQFQAEDGPPFLLLSLKAGGSGLNLTAASHVIHFDRWWNPAVENQATDRAFRIGQRRPVLVQKFLVPGTVEDRIEQMLDRKRALAEDVLAGGEVNLTEMSDDALLEMVQLDVTQATV